MTEAPRSYPVSTGPYAWRCCDERYPFSYGIVTDRKDTVDAWREGNIKFQELHSFVGGVEALVKRAVDFIRLNDPFGDHFPARDLQILAGEPTNIEEQYENCPCGGNDCSAVPGGPLLGCPYVKDSTSEPEIKLTYVKRWRTIVKLPAKYADEIVEALRETPQPASVAQGQPNLKQIEAAIDDHLGNIDATYEDSRRLCAQSILNLYAVPSTESK